MQISRGPVSSRWLGADDTMQKLWVPSLPWCCRPKAHVPRSVKRSHGKCVQANAVTPLGLLPLFQSLHDLLLQGWSQSVVYLDRSH